MRTRGGPAGPPSPGPPPPWPRASGSPRGYSATSCGSRRAP